MSRAPAAALGALALGVTALGAGGLARADEDPVRLSVAVAPVVPAHVRVPLRVRVAADAGGFDPHAGTLRLRVRLAPLCGGDYEGTSGRTVIDRALRPQPASGAAYSAGLSARPRLRRFGRLLVCAFVTDDEARQYATSVGVDLLVSARCTRATMVEASSRSALAGARRRLARTHGKRARARQRAQVDRLGRTLRADGRARARGCRP